MNGYYITILVVQIITAIVIICLTLLQQGKGADMGAAFGSGSAGSVFGSSGSANFLSRMTSASAILFFVATLALAYISSHSNMRSGSILDGIDEPATLIIPEASTTNTGTESSQTPGINQIPEN